MKSAFNDKSGRPYDFGKLPRNWLKQRPGMMLAIGQQAVNFFQDRFRARAWTNRSAQRWPERKKADKNKKRRALLIKSGRLRNSIHVSTHSATAVTVSTPLKYAAAHNFGVNKTVNVKRHTRRNKRAVSVYNIETRRKSTRRVAAGSSTVMAHKRRMKLPQRQFMGHSFRLHLKIDKMIDKTFNKIVKQ